MKVTVNMNILTITTKITHEQINLDSFYEAEIIEIRTTEHFKKIRDSREDDGKPVQPYENENVFYDYQVNIGMQYKHKRYDTLTYDTIAITNLTRDEATELYYTIVNEADIWKLETSIDHLMDDMQDMKNY